MYMGESRNPPFNFDLIDKHLKCLKKYKQTNEDYKHL